MAASHEEMELPLPKDFSYHFSRVTKNRKASKVKQFYKYFQIPGIGNLAGGLPNANYFPFDTLESATALPNRFKPTPNDPVDPPTNQFSRTSLSKSRSDESRIIVPHDSSDPSPLRKIDVATALQYGTSQGFAPLYAFVREFALTKLHPNIPYKDGAEIILDCGSTDGLAKTLECFSNVWDVERDWIREREGLLCEEFAYMNAIQAALPRGLNVAPVAIDDEGMLAYGKGGLLDVLEKWDKNQGKRPHLMYTVTMGQNPTSGLLSVTRRKEIYAICSKYDVLIIEDDPYFYIQFPSANELSMKARGKPVSENYPAGSTFNYQTSTAGGKSSGSAFLDSLVPSYLSVDVDGRVIRLDTFSKTVAPGCRLGWITAQPAIIERIQRITEATTQQPSGFVQAMMAELLLGPDDKKALKSGSKESTGWQMDGWIRWLEGLRSNYERRMQAMCQVLEDGKYIVTDRKRRASVSSSSTSVRFDDDDFAMVSKTQMYDFVYPMAGMFLWVHFHFETHPLFHKVVGARLSLALWIFQTTKDYLVLAAPGSMFAPTDKIREQKGWQYFRLCFAAVDEDKVEYYTKGFAKASADFWEIDDVETIDDILKDLDMSAEGIENRYEQLMTQHGGQFPIFC